MTPLTRVRFAHMDDATEEEMTLIRSRVVEHRRNHLVDTLLELLQGGGGHDFGYQVTRYEHCLQTASRARREGARDDLVVAALFHDVADDIAPDNHSEAAAAILRPFIDEEAHWVVRHHGIFQAYHYAHKVGGDRHAPRALPRPPALRRDGPLLCRVGHARLRSRLRHAAARRLPARGPGGVLPRAGGLGRRMTGDALRVAVLDDYQQVALAMGDFASLGPDVTVDAVGEHLASEDDLAARLAGCQVVVAMRERTAIGAALLDRLPDLRLLVTTGMANAAIDVDAAAGRGVTVCGTGGILTPTSEHTWGLILALLRHIPADDATMRAGGWQTPHGRRPRRSPTRAGRARPARRAGRPGRAGVRHGRGRLEREPHRRALRRGRRAARRPRRAVRHQRRRVGAPRAGRPVARPRRGRRPGPHAARRPCWSTRRAARSSTRRPSSPPCATAASRAPRSTCTTTSPCRPTTRSGRCPNTVLTPHTGYVTRGCYEIFYRDIVEDIAAWRAGAPVRVVAAPPD